jgi:ABC-type bacteriocin/lantibiotic exporter with double-glycine peptidase domain
VPSIIHWNFKHFVVFEGSRGEWALINDPGIGRRRVSRAELGDAFTGIVLAFEPTADFRKAGGPRRAIPMLWRHLSGARAGLALVVLWDHSIEETKLASALQDAAIFDDIALRPGVYDYRIGEGGLDFSGGQRQRLEIARALVGEPSILVLDEATAGLDPVVEERIDENLRRRGCTAVVIAHPRLRRNHRAGERPYRGPRRTRRTDRELPALSRSAAARVRRRWQSAPHAAPPLRSPITGLHH